MDQSLVSPETFQRFLICLARIAALVGTMPVFSGGQTPMRIKAGLAIVFALVVFPVVSPLLPHVPFEPFTLGVLLVKEVMLGMMVGFVARLMFNAVEFGGTVIGYQMGFAAANVFDPQNQRQVSLIAQFQNVFAILIFLAVDGHHLLLRATVESFRMLPPGTENFSGAAIPYLMELTGGMFVFAIKFSAPILAVLLISALVMGIMARVFPQLNVFMLSYSVNIGVSFLVIGMTLNMVAALLEHEFGNMGGQILELFNRL
ncbi:MAG: flagellar biosynthetic protein FliR [Desulfobulbaceae bacterium]|nr:flagellar biosynthetic protein FliR [Desulfobulbaceae bacterium]